MIWLVIFAAAIFLPLSLSALIYALTGEVIIPLGPGGPMFCVPPPPPLPPR